MIDVVMCIRRKAEVSAEEFHRYWLEEHGERVRQRAAAAPTTASTASPW
jgi:hypothetical protein